MGQIKFILDKPRYCQIGDVFLEFLTCILDVPKMSRKTWSPVLPPDVDIPGTFEHSIAWWSVTGTALFSNLHFLFFSFLCTYTTIISKNVFLFDFEKTSTIQNSLGPKGVQSGSQLDLSIHIPASMWVSAHYNQIETLTSSLCHLHNRSWIRMNSSELHFFL